MTQRTELFFSGIAHFCGKTTLLVQSPPLQTVAAAGRGSVRTYVESRWDRSISILPAECSSANCPFSFNKSVKSHVQNLRIEAGNS